MIIRSTLILFILLLVATIQDVFTGKVSNKIILTGVLSGITLNCIESGEKGVVLAILGMIVPVAILFWLFLIKGLGAGDIKLFAVMGSFLGAKLILILIVISLCIGAVLGITKMVANGHIFTCVRSALYYVTDSIREQTLSPCIRTKTNTIHFTIPILISFLIYMGVIML